MVGGSFFKSQLPNLSYSGARDLALATDSGLKLFPKAIKTKNMQKFITLNLAHVISFASSGLEENKLPSFNRFTNEPSDEESC